MMKSLAPVALTGIAGILLWKVLQLLMAPVIAWILGVLAVALKIGLMVALGCLAFYAIRRVVRTRSEGDADADGSEAEA